MKRDLTLVLESPYVAIWFLDVLIDYTRKNEVKIRLVLTGKKRERAGLFGARLFKVINRQICKKYPFFESVDCRKYFKTNTVENSQALLCAVSQDVFREISDSLNKSGFCLIGPHGQNMVIPGLRGLWFFYKYFFSLATPLTLRTENDNSQHGIYFQTRNFTLRKNVGYLQYNLEKVIDHLLSGNPQPGVVLNEAVGTDSRMVRFLGFQMWLLIQKFKENILRPRWQLFLMDAPVLQAGKSKRNQMVSSPSALAWADPMIIDSPDGLFLFLEEVRDGKGHLSVAELDRTTMQMVQPPKAILKKATHLSYPFVFKVETEYYMIPESSSDREVFIYKSEKFPFKWNLHRTLFPSERWVDFTLFFYQNKWWMFGVKKETSYASAYQELYLFFCNNPVKDEWIAHPLNPVVNDVRHARPAGPLFVKGGKILRPAQNCLNRYGGSVMICEVTELSETKYAERVIREIKFPLLSRISSFHTIAFYKDKILGDCFI